MRFSTNPLPENSGGGILRFNILTHSELQKQAERQKIKNEGLRILTNKPEFFNLVQKK